MNKDRSENYPDIIYKYRNWKDDFHKSVLRDNILFMPSPISFNDPFDCRIPTNYTLLDTPEKKHLYAINFMKRHESFIINKGYNINEELKRMEDDLMKNLFKFQNDHEKILFESQNKHYGVLSLSKKWDNILMWSHYAEYHQGYCLGFWEEKLRKSGLFGKGGPVTYNPENNFPIIDPLEDLHVIEKGFKETHTKANDWAYEDEYRLTKLFFPNIPTSADRRIEIPDDFFSEIIIGIMTPENHKQEIIDIAIQKGIKIYQSKKVPFKFEIIREEIVL